MPINVPPLARICEAPGAPGYEKQICNLMLTELKGLADDVRLDNMGICHYRMIEFMKSAAKGHKIKWQPEILAAGGTDTGSLQRMVAGGSSAGAVSIPPRNIHQSIESCHKEDIATCILLLAACVCDLDQHD